MVVIHTIEGSASSGVNTFQNPSSKRSAHYIVSKGGNIYQLVGDKDTAYHVRSSNPRAIGIEHEGFMSRSSTWTDAMYRSSAKLTRWLCDTYRIPIDRRHIVGHKEVPHNDHGDPGKYFNWDYYMRLVRGAGDDSSTGTTPPPGSGSTVGSGTPPRRGIAGSIAGADEDTPDSRDPTHVQLAKKNRGEHVEKLQKVLNQAGYDIDEDGIFGNETEKAVKAFQRANGLEVDGIVGWRTWRKLDRVGQPAATTATTTTLTTSGTPRRPPDGPLGQP